MSFFVTRPLSPLPAMLRTSTWCSRAILRTTGDNRSARASAADQGFANAGAPVGYACLAEMRGGAMAGLAEAPAGGCGAEAEAPGGDVSPSPCGAETGTSFAGAFVGFALATAGLEVATGGFDALSSITPTTVLMGT